jgi:hypothetical protein
VNDRVADVPFDTTTVGDDECAAALDGDIKRLQNATRYPGQLAACPPE